jgi:hypothetical protein
MRDLFYGASTGYVPQGFVPYQSRVPNSTNNRLTYATRLVPNPTNPGYAYGTPIPLTQPKLGLVRWYAPYTLPVGKTFSNQVPMKAQVQGVTMDVTRQQRIPGQVTNVVGYDYSAVGFIQQKLAQTKR